MSFIKKSAVCVFLVFIAAFAAADNYSLEDYLSGYKGSAKTCL